MHNTFTLSSIPSTYQRHCLRYLPLLPLPELALHTLSNISHVSYSLHFLIDILVIGPLRRVPGRLSVDSRTVGSRRCASLEFTRGNHKSTFMHVLLLFLYTLYNILKHFYIMIISLIVAAVRLFQPAIATQCHVLRRNLPPPHLHAPLPLPYPGYG